jgi:hypothetical protein
MRNDALLAHLGCILSTSGDRGRSGSLMIYCLFCEWIEWVWRGPLPQRARITPQPTCPICGGDTMSAEHGMERRNA